MTNEQDTLAEPTLQPLPRGRRRLFFISFIVIFVIAVPIFAFYATGYRFDFDPEQNRIVSVGGMYVSADVDDIAIYVNDELVDDMRFFQNAAYIQNLTAGQHQIHTQGPAVQTWVKSLPVFPHIVTTVQSFNLPMRPQIRIVAPWETAAGEGVLWAAASSSFPFASTTDQAFFVATSTATSTYASNIEYTFLAQRFASATAEKALVAAALNPPPIESFAFSTEQASTATTSLAQATSTIIGRDITLNQIDEEVYATYTGSENDIPRYFCVQHLSPASTSVAYGEHVLAALTQEFPTTTVVTIHDTVQTLCRNKIKIDRLRQTVHDFDFLPGSESVVLMHLDDGIYAVELDDRAWQNTQLLFPGYHLELLVDGGQIFVKDTDMIVEVFTETIN